jgi:hypothetical protein
MKQLTMNLMAAAALVLAAGSASAQSLKADIPFTFHAAGAVMTPGTYQIVNPSLGSKYVVIRNADTRQSVIAVYDATDVTKELKAQGRPGIQFECSGAYCSLRQIWKDNGGPAYGFRVPKSGSEGEKHMAFVPLTATKAD